MNNIVENKYQLGNIIQYIIELVFFVFGIIFFGTKKNNRRIISKITPLSESDEEIGHYNNIIFYNDIDTGYEHIPLHRSIIEKNYYYRKNNGKIKKE